MASNNNISLEDLPSPDQLLTADQLPSPEELHPSLPKKIAKNVQSAIAATKPATEGALDLGSNLLNTGIDVARGVGQGLTFGATDELGGALSAAGEYLYNKLNPTDAELKAKGFDIQQPTLPDLYRKNQQSIQKELESSSERSPWLYTAGQLAGGVTSGSALGGLLKGAGAAEAAAPKLLDIARNEGKLKALGELGLRGAKAYKEALPAILAESALSSKEGGVLTPEERSKLGEDVVGGALFGLPTVMGLSAFSEAGAPLAAEKAGALKQKLSQITEETPLLRQMRVAYNYGREGINPKSQLNTLNTDLGAANPNLTQLDNDRSQKLLNEIYDAKNRVGQGISDALNNATTGGKVVDLGSDIGQSLNQLQTLANKYPEITNNARASQVFSKLASGDTRVTPLEAKDLIDYMDAYIGKFKSSTNKTPAEEGILGNLFQTRQQLSNTLKTSVPEYGQAAERYNQFMKLVPETIISGSRPVNVTGEFFGDMRDQDRKLFDQLKKMNQGTTREEASTQPVKEAFVNTIKGMKTFEQQEAERLANGQISQPAFNRPASAIEKEIKANSDDAVARGAMDALQPSAGVGTTLTKAVAGVGGTGKSMSISAANIGGRAVNRIAKTTEGNPVSKVVRGIYTAPQETVLALSQKLKSTPGLEKYGTSLEEALNSPDVNRRNQVLFTIMQNPKARLFVGDENPNQQEETPSGSYTPEQ